VSRSTIKTLVVDEFRIVAESLGIVLSLESDLTFVGAATSPEEAIAMVEEFEPDVVVVDIDVPVPGNEGFDGIDVTGRIKQVRPETRVLVLSGVLDVDAMSRAASQGACGFLAKSSSPAEICEAVRTAKDGGMFVERELVPMLIDRLKTSRGRRAIEGGSSRAELTRREHDVLTLLGEGLDVTLIARRLNITVNTARGHVKNVLAKLGSHSQLEAVVEAVHQGLLPHLSRD
jgi:DNA-binding NarL/FixJ family response regulator